MSASRLSLSRPEHGSTWMANEPEGNAENLKTDSLKELAAWFGVESSRFIDEGAHYISQELFTTQNIVMLASPVIGEEVFSNMS